MNFAYGEIVSAAGGSELFPWFAVMFGILFVVVVGMLLKTRRR